MRLLYIYCLFSVNYQESKEPISNSSSTMYDDIVRLYTIIYILRQCQGTALYRLYLSGKTHELSHVIWKWQSPYQRLK